MFHRRCSGFASFESDDLPRVIWSARQEGAKLICALLLASCGALSAPQAAAQESPPVAPAATPSAGELVARLADADYKVRESAERQLREMSLAAKPALVEGLRHADVEVRRRCRAALTEVLERDFRDKVAALRKEPSGTGPIDLPGWTAYRDLVGADKASRELFAEMISEEPGIFASLAVGAMAPIRLRASEVFHQIQIGGEQPVEAPGRATIAALLIVSAQPKMDGAEWQNVWNNLANNLQHGAFAEALKAGQVKEPLRALTEAWLRAPGATQFEQMKLRIAISQEFNDVALAKSLAVLSLADKRSPQDVASALECVAIVGGKDYAALLQRHLKDERTLQTRILPMNERQDMLVRDVVLALLVDLTGQEFPPYGFSQAKNWFDIVKRQKQNRGNLVFNFGNFFPDKGVDRAAMLKKWETWVAEHPLPEIPAPPKYIEEFRAQALARPAPPAAGAKPVGGAARKVDAPQAASRGLQIADREIVSALKRVPALLAEERYSEAAKIVGEILAADEDYCYRPDLDSNLYRQVKAQAEQLLAKFPAVALEEYELNYGPLARKLLEESLAKNDYRVLAEVERRYFFTKVGSEAAFLLGTHHRTQGRFTTAALYFERLRRLGRDADRYEPALSTQLALCWHQAGMSRQAGESMTRLLADGANREVRIGGKAVATPAVAGEVGQWLAAIAGTAVRIEPQWSVFAGTASGNSPAGRGAPWLPGAVWNTPSTNAWLDGLIQTLPAAFVKERRTQLPTIRPLVAGSQVIVRTPLSLISYRRDSGQIAWESRPTTNLSTLLQFAEDKQRDGRVKSVTAALRRRLWDDLGFGALSTDGRFVFALDDPGVRLGGVSRWLRVRDDGEREIDDTPFSGLSRLVAYDLQTGKVVWERGGGKHLADALAGGRFQGPPLPLGDQAFVVVELPEQTLLVALDVETGATREQWLLDASPDEAPQPVNDMLAEWQSETEPLHSTSPSYSDGVLICRTSRNRYVAFDLTQRSVRWSFKAPVPEADARQRMMRRAFQQQGSQPQELRSEEWCDSGPLIAEGRVLVTPHDDDQLYCLNATDGTLVWTAPRQDGVQVTGVYDGRVVITGRSGATARRLSDGKPAWRQERIEWPGGATPSGRGYLSRDALHVPLNNAEIVTVDVREGRLVARARHRDGVVAGNLVQVEDEAYAWTGSGLRRFETLASRAANVPADAPDLPVEQRLARAEILRNEGRLDDALAVLQDVRRTAPSPECDRLLGETLLLVSLEQIKERLPLVEELAQNATEPAVRGGLWLRAAQTRRQGEAWREAFAAYGKWMNSGEPLDRTLDLTASRQARRSQVVRAELEGFWGDAPAAARAELEAPLLELLAAAATVEQIEALGFHPGAQEARLRLARQQFDGGKILAAELLWRNVWQEGDDAQRAQAAARLAQLLQGRGAIVESARFYRELNDAFADAPCLDGKTGRQLIAELPADGDVARQLSTGDLFPSTKPKVEVAAKNEQPPEASSTMIYMPLRPAHDGSPLAPNLFVAIDQRNRKLFGCDATGVRRWAVELASPQNANVLGLQNQGFAECRAVGHLVIAWLGSRVFAVDPWTDGGKVIWTRELMGDDPNRWWRLGQFQRRMQIMAVGGPTQAELGAHFTATRRYVAFQESRLLTAVDPLTGATLWMRDDLPPGCELFGDARHLVAIPPDKSEMRVYRATDGAELRRHETPGKGKRIVTVGASWVTFDAEGAEAKLERFDLVEGRSVWQRTFAKQAKATAIDDSQLGVLEPSGKFVALAVDDARIHLETALDRMDDLESVVAMRNDRDYYVIANRAEPKSDVPFGVNRRQPGHLRVDGVMYAIEVGTAKRRWQRAIEDQSIVVCHPTAAPVFVLLHRRQKVTPVGNGGWTSAPPVLHLSLLDRRSGEVLHTAEFKNGYDVSFRMNTDPAKREFVFQNAQQLVTLTYPQP